MGSALYVSIKDKPDDLDTSMNGKALARAWDVLDALAPTLGALPISKLCNASWKNPDKGRPDIEKYLAHVRANPASVPDAPDVIEDLEDVLRLIGDAQKLGTKWRLMLDY